MIHHLRVYHLPFARLMPFDTSISIANRRKVSLGNSLLRIDSDSIVWSVCHLVLQLKNYPFHSIRRDISPNLVSFSPFELIESRNLFLDFARWTQSLFLDDHLSWPKRMAQQKSSFSCRSVHCPLLQIRYTLQRFAAIDPNHLDIRRQWRIGL